jgi:hypothetical protein
MGHRRNVKCSAELQKSPTGRTPIHEVEIEEFLQAKEGTDVIVQDQNNVDLLFRHQGYHPF